MRRHNRTILLLLMAALAAFLPVLILTGCTPQARTVPERLDKFRFDSQILGKSMGLQVYLPPDYDPESAYPVLYFLPDGGGSDYTVVNDYEIGICADQLLAAGKIRPLIIVAVDTDRSFGLNTAETTGTIDLPSGKQFDLGRYEDYFIQEVIPLIESRYAAGTARADRLVGGYSAGGFAALYLAFTHPDLFGKAGGHSPSLFVQDFPDKAISDWLYPDETTRDRRDPLHLARINDLSGLQVYLDTGAADVNVEGCQVLADLLQDKGVACASHYFAGVHSRTYCRQYMPEYLLFYAS